MLQTVWGLYRNPRRGRADLIRFRDGALRRLVARVYNEVSFYRDWFDAAGVRPDDIRRAEDLAALPLLSKSDLRNAPLESRLARSTDPAKLISHKTSGSTGEPFTVYRTHSEENLLHLFRLRAARQYGFRFRDRRVDVTAPLDGGAADPLRRIVRALRLGRVEAFDATTDLDELLPLVARIEPDVLTGYPCVLAKIAVQTSGPEKRSIRPRLVITGGEPMTPLARARIERGFGAPVYDMYGSNEFNLLASQCPRNDHLHVCDDSVIVEVLRDGAPTREGEQGEVVVTGLFSRTMPFIRYRTGDLAIKGADVCPCGQPFSTLSAIQGRVMDYLRLPDGRMVHPFVVGNSLSVDGDAWIEQHQLQQVALDRVVLRLKLRRPPTADERERLMKAVERVCHPARLDLEFVDHFEPHPSGKFRSYLGLDDMERTLQP